jgi:hypothetical protein
MLGLPAPYRTPGNTASQILSLLSYKVMDVIFSKVLSLFTIMLSVTIAVFTFNTL